MNISFDDQVAVVTGAGSGLGREYALALAARGAKVAVLDVGSGGASPAAARVAAEIAAAGGVASPHCTDVTRYEQVQASIDRCLDEWERIDIVINNAGALLPGSLADSSLASLSRAMDVNFWGSLYVCKAVWDHMCKRHYGRVVLTTSSAGLYGSAGILGYCAAKAALVGLMNGLHAEGQSSGIRVNCIAPTAATDMNRSLLPANILPLMEPSAVVPAVLFLSSDQAPSRSIVSAGAGVFAATSVVDAKGEYLCAAQRIPEVIRDRFPLISDLTGASPANGSYAQTIGMVRRAAQAENVDLAAGSTRSLWER